MRSVFLATSLAVVAFLAGCDKDANDCKDCILLSYSQTQCADPWGYGADGSDVAVEYALRDFFASQGVVIDEVSVSGTATPITNCTVCTCPTGKTIFASLNASDTAALTSRGFYR